MAPVSGREPAPSSPPSPPQIDAEPKPESKRATTPAPRPMSVDDEAPTIDTPTPAPKKRPVTVEEEGDPTDDMDMDAATLAVTQPLPPSPKRTVRTPAAPLAEVPIRPLPGANTSQRLPWLVAALLGVAVAVLVAYIVLT